MSNSHKLQHCPPDSALWFLSLGGATEIGMNLNLYGTAGKWLMVDCGVTFGDETTPGVEIIMPNISFIAERSADLLGIVITHAHEDHFGAIQYLWPQLRCPIYATKFAADLIRSKLVYAGLQGKVQIIELPLDGSFEVGPFKCDFIPVTHSVPEAHMIAIRTQHGNVLHTGDWKLDEDPIIGGLTDTEKLIAFGEEGVLAVVGDSTNALIPGKGHSEREARNEFDKLFPTISKRIVVTCFSSNVARLKSIAQAAHRCNRQVSLVGRSLWRNAEMAEDCGYLPEFNDFLSENDAMVTPRERIVIVSTGCQGEAKAALCRIAVDDHPEVTLDAGDTVVFSSRDIPGNEKAIARLQNNLVARGIHVITGRDRKVHVSGHFCQDDLALLYKWIRPRIAMPVHGEARHQSEHARIARENGVEEVIVPANGQIIRLGPGVHEVVAEVESGRWGLDGKILRRMDHDISKDRKKLSYNGAIVVTMVMDAKGRSVRDPQVSIIGLIDDAGDDPLCEEIASIALDAVEEMPKSARIDDAAVRHAVSLAVRRRLKELHGKKPVTEVQVVRL